MERSHTSASSAAQPASTKRPEATPGGSSTHQDDEHATSINILSSYAVPMLPDHVCDAIQEEINRNPESAHEEQYPGQRFVDHDRAEAIFRQAMSNVENQRRPRQETAPKTRLDEILQAKSKATGNFGQLS